MITAIVLMSRLFNFQNGTSSNGITIKLTELPQEKSWKLSGRHFGHQLAKQLNPHVSRN